MDAPPEDTLFGAVVNYTCLMGYETSAGNPTTSSICEADSSWSTLDACDRKSWVQTFIIDITNPE